MRYISTNTSFNSLTFRQAVLKGLADDGGLFMPERIPVLSAEFWRGLAKMDYHQAACRIAERFCSPDVQPDDLEEIIRESMNFPLPLNEVESDTSILELFHGPTLAFKDFGARFMARVMSRFAKDLGKELTVLVATSGDTGSAVGRGFHGIDGIRVFLLYPSGRVSRIQEMQLTTIGNNVTALEISGTFDDCQALTKTAFQDDDLNEKITLTSANSINISRLIPQSLYYIDAYRRAGGNGRPVVFSVPSGNLGNLTAGIMALKMGLPVKRFIAAANSNAVFPQYVDTGNFLPRPAVETISNAMDVGNPSNLARIRAIYEEDIDALRSEIAAESFSDQSTLDAIRSVYKETGYILDPHGAVGYLAWKHFKDLEDFRDSHGIILETAHPAKFRATVEKALGREIQMPESLAECMTKEKESIRLPAGFKEFKEFLLANAGA